MSWSLSAEHAQALVGDALRLRVGRRNAGLSHKSVGKLDAGRTPQASDVEDANDAK